MGFQYQPLNPGEIRLLKFSPQPSSSLSFEIVHKSLSSKPRYAALSYAWGLPGGVDDIWLNGQRFSIRPNLYHALKQLQSSKVVDQYLWVDAICINQGKNTNASNKDALDERSIQITLMKQIYEQAAKVCVWLGKPENEANNRLAFLKMKDFQKRFRRVARKARPYRPWWWQYKARTPGEDIADFLLTVSPARDKEVFDVPGSQTYKAWLGIISLWKSPWWNRTWIFQESTVPEKYTSLYWSGFLVHSFSNKVMFLCGDQEASWSEISHTTIVAMNIIATPGIDSEFLAGAQKPVDRLMKFRTHRIVYVLRSFLDILQMFRHTECSDPRDKVYAPLCLAPDDVRRYITPNYANKTVLDVYLDVVRYYLGQSGHDLDFLGYALYDEETQAVETPEGVKSVLPSWVPNFSASLEIVPIPKILHVPKILGPKGLKVYDKRGLPDNKETLIAAYRPLGDVTWRSFIQDGTLCVRGACIDTLKDIILNTGPDLEAIRASAREQGRKWAIESKHKYFTGETYSDAIKRTVMLDLVYDELGRPSERGGKLDNAFLARPRAELSLTEYRYQMDMRNAKTKASVLRNLGLSEKLYLLMIPNTAVVGDVIWALAGGQALYILRPMNSEISQYRFIGECYAHGLMDGDILRRLHMGKAKMEDISLI